MYCGPPLCGRDADLYDAGFLPAVASCGVGLKEVRVEEVIQPESLEALQAQVLLALGALEDRQEKHVKRVELLLQQHQASLLDSLQTMLGAGARTSGELMARARTAGEDGGRSITTSRSTRPSRISRFSDQIADMSRSLHRGFDPRSRILRFTERKRNMEEAAHGMQHSHHASEPFALERVGLCSRVAKCISRRRFEVVVNLLVLANSAALGIQVDWRMRHAGKPEPAILSASDFVFSFVFLIEILLRLVAVGPCVLFQPSNKNFTWNVFDSVLVASSIINHIGDLVNQSGMNLAVIRLLRVLRVIRVLRVLRVLRFFSDLRILISCIGSSFKSLVWALVLHLVLEFIVGVVIMDFVSQSFDGEPDLAEEVLVSHFGSIGASLGTLFMAMSGGVEWGTVAEPLVAISPWLGVFFALYIAISIFCILNIITGLFVENAKKVSQRDELSSLMESLEDRQKWMEEVEQLFNAITTPGADNFTLDNLREKIKDVKLQSMFIGCGLDIEVENAAGLFQLLDFDMDGDVDLDEFALGVQMLHGSARSIDVARLRHNLDRVMQDLSALTGAFLGVSEASEENEDSQKSDTHRSTLPTYDVVDVPAFGMHASKELAGEAVSLQPSLASQADASCRLATRRNLKATLRAGGSTAVEEDAEVM